MAYDTYVDIVHNGRPGRHKADYLRLDTREAYQIKTITSSSATRQHIQIQKGLVDAVKQLNGEKKPATSGEPPEQAPPGFSKIVKLRLEHQTGASFLMDRDDLVTLLRRTQAYPKIRDGRLDRLEIVNGYDSGTTHVWTREQLEHDLG